MDTKQNRAHSDASLCSRLTNIYVHFLMRRFLSPPRRGAKNAPQQQLVSSLLRGVGLGRRRRQRKPAEACFSSTFCRGASQSDLLLLRRLFPSLAFSPGRTPSDDDRAAQELCLGVWARLGRGTERAWDTFIYTKDNFT